MSIVITILAVLGLLYSLAHLVLGQRQRYWEVEHQALLNSHEQILALAERRGTRYASTCYSEGEMAAELDDFATIYGIKIVNSVEVDGVGAIMALSANGDRLLILSNTDQGVFKTILASHEIISVNVTSEIETRRDGNSPTVPDGWPGVEQSHRTNTWVKVATRNVHRPWIAICLPDKQAAERWRHTIEIFVTGRLTVQTQYDRRVTSAR